MWFGVEPGEIVCVVGSHDSGKEALARCAAGMDPFAGDALFADGAASARRGGVAALAAAGVGACLRDDAFVDETATPLEHLELVAAFRGARNPARVAREIAAAAGLFDRDGDPTGVDGDDGSGGTPNGDFSFPAIAETPLRALDASARRRTSLAAATVGDPAVLILDAPTRAVDSSARRRVWRRLADHARRGGAVLASTDAVDEAEAIASRVVAMADGRVVDLGTPRQLKARHGAAYTLKVQLRGDGRDGTDASSNPASREDAEATHALVASAAPRRGRDGGVGRREGMSVRTRGDASAGTRQTVRHARRRHGARRRGVHTQSTDARADVSPSRRGPRRGTRTSDGPGASDVRAGGRVPHGRKTKRRRVKREMIRNDE